jgi:hypothetical protein
MADRKISDLTALTTPASGDYVPIVDISEVAAASKNKRITIEELFRGVPLGTAAAPSIAIEGDEDTGVFSPGANQLAISTAGTGRLFVNSTGLVGLGTSSPDTAIHVNSGTIDQAAHFESSDSNVRIKLKDGDATNAVFVAGKGDNLAFETAGNNERARIDSSGRVGIGTTSPSTLLEIARLGSAWAGVSPIAGTALFVNSGSAITTSPTRISILSGNAASAAICFGDTDNNSKGIIELDNADDSLQFSVNNSERARIDSSGRLLVGTSTSTDLGSSTHTVQVSHAAGGSASFTRYAAASAAGPIISLGRSRSGTVGTQTAVQNGDVLGRIYFAGSNGTDLSNIGVELRAEVDGEPFTAGSTTDLPSRLVFSTTADGASSPTERLRITSAGVLQVADAGNISVGTTTGTKIGTATTQKLGFYNATPVVQPAAVADATDAASVITQLNALLTRMRNLGLIAT